MESDKTATALRREHSNQMNEKPDGRRDHEQETRAQAPFGCLRALLGDRFLAKETLRGPIESDPARTSHVPVMGVAKSGWTIDQFFGRGRVRLAQYAGGVDEREFANGDFAERMLP
jgi:hypothetical protein